MSRGEVECNYFVKSLDDGGEYCQEMGLNGTHWIESEISWTIQASVFSLGNSFIRWTTKVVSPFLRNGASRAGRTLIWRSRTQEVM